MREPRKIGILGISPVHPGRGEPSFIGLNISLNYLAGSPVECVTVSRDKALRLLEQLAVAIRVTS